MEFNPLHNDNIILVGANHKTAAIEMRERIQCSAEELNSALEQLAALEHIKECVIVSTCNRIEYYVVSPSIEQGLAEILNFIRKFKDVADLDLTGFTYQMTNSEAVKHLLEVVSSLDSLVVGENQIQGQVGDAYQIAQKTGLTRGTFNKLFQSAIHLGRKVRHETEIGRGAVSIGSATVELITEVFAEGEDLTVLLVGAGEIGAVTLEQLARYGDINLIVANRTLERGQKVAERFNGRAIPFDDRYQAIKDADIIISCTGADHFVLEYEPAKKAVKSSRKVVQTFIDLSVPRNIDPKLNEVDDIIVYCVDDLQSTINENKNKRQALVNKAERIIDEAAGEFLDWQRRKRDFAAKKRLENAYAEIEDKVLTKNQAALAGLDDAQKEVLSSILQEVRGELLNSLLQSNGQDSSKTGSDKTKK